MSGTPGAGIYEPGDSLTTRIIAVRHAPAVADGLCYGRHDVAVSLSPDETAAAVIAAVRAQGVVPHQVWSSSSSRCLAPAVLIAQRLGLPLRVDERLSELGFGEWEDRSWKEIEANDAAMLRAWMLAWQTLAPPGGETVEELESRVRAWYQSLDEERCHLLVGHAGVIRALRVIRGQCDWPSAMGRGVPSLTPEHFDRCEVNDEVRTQRG